MPALNYAQAYSQALAQAYPYVLHFAALRSTENDSRYRWTGANTIQIPSLTTTGRVDADRDTIGVAKRNFNNAWEPKTLTNHRKWSTLVHPLDIDETNQVASIQNITKVFNEEQKFPEMDAYLVSKLYAEWTSAMAVCAMAEALYAFDLLASGEAGPVQSASIGSVSVSYVGSTAQAVDISPAGQARELYRCASLYLDICRGVG